MFVDVWVLASIAVGGEVWVEVATFISVVVAVEASCVCLLGIVDVFMLVTIVDGKSRRTGERSGVRIQAGDEGDCGGEE
jgi:hypothetical protein